MVGVGMVVMDQLDLEDYIPGVKGEEEDTGDKGE